MYENIADEANTRGMGDYPSSYIMLEKRYKTVIDTFE